MGRIARRDYFLGIARLVAARSTCIRRQAGCVIVDRHNHVLATGYNGVPKGHPHCNEGFSCPAADASSGSDLEGCLATHAEMNALLQCRDTDRIERIYCTCSPCITCTKLILNTSCQGVIFLLPYADEKEACRLWSVTRYPCDWICTPDTETA